MNRRLAGIFIECPRVERSGPCSKVALAHLLGMDPPACPVCGARIEQQQIDAALEAAGKATP